MAAIFRMSAVRTVTPVTWDCLDATLNKQCCVGSACRNTIRGSFPFLSKISRTNPLTVTVHSRLDEGVPRASPRTSRSSYEAKTEISDGKDKAKDELQVAEATAVVLQLSAALEKIAILEKEKSTLESRVTELQSSLEALAAAPSLSSATPSPSPTSTSPSRSPVSPTATAEDSLSPTGPATEIPSSSDKPSPDGHIFSGFPSISWPSPSDNPPFWEKLANAATTGAATAGGNAQASGTGAVDDGMEKDADRLHVIHLTAEMAPIAKVGGLGDVVTGLARACLMRGHTVQVFLPFYECIPLSAVEDLTSVRAFGSYHRGNWIGVQAHEGKVEGVPVVFLKPENHFFRGSGIYGGSYDELEAYLFFTRACLEYLQVNGMQPDIIHAHEWHLAAVGMLYWDMYHHLALKKPRLVFTIHNMEHYGECRWEQLDWCGLNGQSYVSVEKAMDDRTIGHNPERLSLLKAGIVYSNAVTTVSPTYARETLCSGWLAGTLQNQGGKYSGILNGIDTSIWDPRTDPFLPVPFSGEDLRGKALAKHYLQRGLGLELELPPPDGDHPLAAEKGETKRIPLVVCITRLVAQKGIHLIRRAMFRTLEMGGQFVLLGSAPDPRIQGEFKALAEQFATHKSCRLLLTYSDPLSHLLYAAGDITIVPSMFEPCGLTQMTGMRYGTVPLVRRTGGLADTVFDVDDPAHASTERGNGYVFDGIDEGSLDGALDRALQCYKGSPERWAQLSSRVMGLDNSWNKSAGEYLNLYRSVRVH
eukprot:TRINITY_DN29333_c0_g1_i1.p1 TRINITY_DN29333_c0_g1~~TRINITY_DN29333_c0_g1_i1.p1  ORF type:complete len:759 (+),score=106.00 TRINITY_DN29333_c0_g1_i1:152-2428(+)